MKFGTPLRFEILHAEAHRCSKDRLKEIYQEVADEIVAAIERLSPWEEKSTFP